MKRFEQEYLIKDPTRKLRIPKNLRQKDKRVLDWEMLWAILATAPRRDRLLLAIDIAEALRPSELFALRWRPFDNQNTLKIMETVYRGELRPHGKTVCSLTKVFLPDGLQPNSGPGKLEAGNVSPDEFIFPNADGGFLLVSNYRNRVLKPLAERLRIEKLNFQILRRTMATQAQNMGSVKTFSAPGARAARYERERVHAGPACKRSADGRIGVPDAHERRGRNRATRGHGKTVICGFVTNATNSSEPRSVSC